MISVLRALVVSSVLSVSLVYIQTPKNHFSNQCFGTDLLQHDVIRVAQYVLILGKMLKNLVTRIHIHCKCFSAILLHIHSTNGKKIHCFQWKINMVCLAHVSYINKINNLINNTRWKVQGKDNKRAYKVPSCPLIGSVSVEEGSGVFGEF